MVGSDISTAVGSRYAMIEHQVGSRLWLLRRRAVAMPGCIASSKQIGTAASTGPAQGRAPTDLGAIVPSLHLPSSQGSVLLLEHAWNGIVLSTFGSNILRC